MPRNLTESLRKQIDSHGYAFQLSVAAFLRTKCSERSINFRVEAEEVAVESGDKPTHIDLVVSNLPRSVWFVCESKRCDPAISNWCFARMPVIERLGPTDVVAEVLRYVRAFGEIRTRGALVATHADQYDFSFELRSGDSGDGGSGRGALKDALSQVVRQTNGYVGLLARNSSLIDESQPAAVIPVIFTTARLWVTSDDLSNASLEDGRISSAPTDVQEKDWICFRYRQSTALRHSIGRVGSARNLAEVVVRDSIRTVFIVRADECLSFFEWAQRGIQPSWDTEQPGR